LRILIGEKFVTARAFNSCFQETEERKKQI